MKEEMKKEIREVTMEELLELVKTQAGDFLIHVEPGKEDTHGNEGTLSA